MFTVTNKIKDSGICLKIKKKLKWFKKIKMKRKKIKSSVNSTKKPLTRAIRCLPLPTPDFSPLKIFWISIMYIAPPFGISIAATYYIKFYETNHSYKIWVLFLRSFEWGCLKRDTCYYSRRRKQWSTWLRVCVRTLAEIKIIIIYLSFYID